MKDMLLVITFCSMLILCVYTGIQKSQIEDMQKTVTSIERRMDAVAWVATRYKGQQNKENQEWMKRDKKIIELNVDNDRLWGRIGGLSYKLEQLEEWKEKHDPTKPEAKVQEPD